ncbi:CDP-diacylglycerol--glycerol-3-phosphate 3-phosphatidyltransferase [Candidatus Poribacteria bacterium]|nr:CDP-diacylglycerol--glycerol-3-phosphate 3-phosphatidyltransferase [Candidatus Poribacteria bacterium]
MKRAEWSPFGLANALTVLRILITPLFMLAFFHGYRHAEAAQGRAAFYYLGALFLFGLASLSDYLDGKIARQRGVTEFGKFFDPIADKLLVLTALLSLRYYGELIPIWMVLVIAGREIAVTLLRSALVARAGRVVSANLWGKMKTVSQMTILVVSLLLLSVNSAVGYPYEGLRTSRGPIFWMMLVPVTLTVLSGIEFVYSNRSNFRALATGSEVA